MSMLLVLEPQDTLFFRDNRPFSAGLDVLAESTLPSPLTLFGAIGSYILEKNNTDLEQFFNRQVSDRILGEYDSDLKNSNLKTKGPFFIKRNKLYFSPPANLFKIDGVLKALKPDVFANPRWDIIEKFKPISIPGDEFEPEKRFLPEDYINKFLLDNLISLPDITEENFYLKEAMFGHKLNKETFTVEEGFLYKTEHLRFTESLRGKEYDRTGIALFVDGIESSIFSPESVFFGGDRRKAYLKILNKRLSFPEDDITNNVLESKRFTLYFVTPAIFSEGFYRPQWPKEFKDINARLVGIAIKKPFYISGWKRTRVSSGHPRPLKKAVPPGSVYFFECDNNINEGSFKTLYRKYNFNESLSHEYPNAGFGIALIGIW